MIIFIYNNLAIFKNHLIPSSRYKKTVPVLDRLINWYNQFLTRDIIEI